MLSGFFGSLFQRGKPAKERRRLPVAGRCPDVGKKIFRRNMVMQVTDPMPQDLWNWLVLMGWRESTTRVERRRYSRLPEKALSTLIGADRSDREVVYQELIGNI